MFLVLFFYLYFFLFCFLIFLNFFNEVYDCGLGILFTAFGISFCLLPLLISSFYNRCDVCEKYVSSYYCTDCGSFVSSESLCSCGAEIYEKYKYCPSCGSGLEASDD